MKCKTVGSAQETLGLEIRMRDPMVMQYRVKQMLLTMLHYDELDS
jgi:hypothetical protein